MRRNERKYYNWYDLDQCVCSVKIDSEYDVVWIERRVNTVSAAESAKVRVKWK